MNALRDRRGGTLAQLPDAKSWLTRPATAGAIACRQPWPASVAVGASDVRTRPSEVGLTSTTWKLSRDMRRAVYTYLGIADGPTPSGAGGEGLAQLPYAQNRLTRPASAGASAVLYKQPWPTHCGTDLGRLYLQVKWRGRRQPLNRPAPNNLWLRIFRDAGRCRT